VTRQLWLLVGLLAGCDKLFGLQHIGPGAGSGDAGTGDWWDPAWTARRQLVFEHATGTEDLVDFPVLVALDATRIDFGIARPGGEDLRFIDADGETVLPHEIELWEPPAAYAWVRIPQIDAHSTTDHVWMYWGNPAAIDSQRPDQVWADYHAVWHLGEQGSGAIGEYVDSSPHRHHARGGTGAWTPPVREPGRIAHGQRFDGQTTSIALSHAASSSFNFDEPQLTLEVWVKPDPDRPDWNDALAFDGYTTGYRLEYSRLGIPAFQLANTSLSSSGTIPDNAWSYLVATYDGSDMRLYVDGLEHAARTRAGELVPSDSVVRIGRYSVTGEDYDYPVLGMLDEPRIANVTRSAAWIAAQYRSMKDMFVSFLD
jgi:hypothetical protein